MANLNSQSPSTPARIAATPRAHLTMPLELPANSPTVYPEELKLLELLNAKEPFTVKKVKRNSIRIYDLHVDGDMLANGRHVPFIAWLPLFALRNLTCWTHPAIANECDYPEMALDGDWSGIRDTETDHLWLIFEDNIGRPLRFKRPIPYPA